MRSDPPPNGGPERGSGRSGARWDRNADPQDPATYAPRRRYPWHDDPDYDPTAHRRTPPQERPAPSQPPPSQPPQSQQGGAQEPRRGAEPGSRRVPRKLTVTRVAAMRGREFAEGGIRLFHRAATADGADRSGLTALTYVTMADYAVDAAIAVALANTLFFAAATAESTTNVALYLAITVAPFAVVAPVIGPLFDRLQRGRRAALAVAFAGRALLAVVMAFNYDSWLLYPAALGAMVLSKSTSVLKAAITPRVLPERISLVTTNSRLTTFGLAAGGVCGAVAAGVAAAWGSPGALLFTAACAVVGGALCLRIPGWVEVTEGEVPAALRGGSAKGKRRPMSRAIVVALWGTGAIRALTGFLTLFVAFVVKAQTETDATRQLLLIGIVGGAAGAGSFLGNAIGSRRSFGRSDVIILACVGGAVAVAALAAAIPGIATAAVVGLVGATVSAIAKVCLDAVIQRDLPEESRASAFGRSETVLQLTWVFGGALGVLLPHSTFWIGFAVIAAVVALGGVQTALLSRGRTMLPFLGRTARPAGGEPVRTVR